MIDTDFPVWTIRPNWDTPVVERLDWLTDVMQSSSGAVQTASVRVSPRRSFETAFNPVDQERSYMDLWIHRVGDQKLLTPIWHDKGRLSATAAKSSGRLYLDTRWREIEVGGLVLIHSGDAFNYEVCLVEAIDHDGIDLVGTTGKQWRRGSAVYPLREAYLDMDLAQRAISSRVGGATLLFKLDGPNDLTSGVEPLPVYQNYPIMSLEPNRVDPIDMSFHRIMGEQDQLLGTVYRRDNADRAFTVQGYNWRVRGREQSHYLRQAFYRLRGRAQAVWMPTFNQDVVLAAPAVAGNNFLMIKQTGLRYLGGPANGRDHVMFRAPGTDAPLILKLSGTGLSHDDAVERVNLDTVLDGDLPAGRVGSFIDTARCDNDTIEIHHYSDTDGLCEASAAFRSFKNSRDSSGVTYVAIPDSAQAYGTCGNPDGPEPNDPCAVPFAGDYRHWIWFHTVPCNTGMGPTRNLSLSEDWQPNAPNGKIIGQINNFSGSVVILEKDDAVNPLSPHYGDPAWANCRGQLLATLFCGNQTIDAYFYGIGVMTYILEVQYPAFYCSSVGLDNGDVAVDVCSVVEDSPLCVPARIDLGVIFGNTPLYYSWEI